MRPRDKLEPGQYYLIGNNGNNNEMLFVEERNFPYFLMLWKRHIRPIAELISYILTNDQFQAVIRVKSEEQIRKRMIKQAKEGSMSLYFSQCFSNLFNAYAKSINKAYFHSGSLFQERYCCSRINSEEELKVQICQVHLYPERIGIADHFEKYSHSSYRALMASGKTMLDRDIVMKCFGGRTNFIKAHEWFRENHKIHLAVQEVLTGYQ